MPKEYDELWQELQERAKYPIERLIRQGVELATLKAIFEDLANKMLKINA
ncbi:hypothetical protein [Tepidanaerobacter syntrophicus]|uniref:Uncharacterized protein n=1 Tax=Tepidanaerobacter syntrophicus TaxID=224999 RepID=A0A0U9HNU0_9FIRM|nr:hypothetical protein [Tepidanaerobacter syntrophicus]GAQ26035.1 hypothetical protein TSYNT_9291 [Tepidanaerobacter syntrophicus]HHV82603.1 hypothetical protein [Tepidanaerobacter syntrophicus]